MPVTQVHLLTRRPALAATAIVTLAIGIGVTTAVLSLAEHVLWHALPLADADRLVSLTETDLQSGRSMAVSGPNFRDWQTRTRAVESMAVVAPVGTDPMSYLLAGACLAAITLAGCVLPGWRASRVDPVLALRTA